MAEVAVNPDGTFVIPKVPPGLYFLRPMGGTVLPRTQLVRVASQDITDLVVEGQLGATVSGRVVTVDAAGRQLPTPIGIRVSFQRPDGGSSTVVRPDGSFSMTLVEGDHYLVLTNLPAGYSIKSKISGNTDIEKTGLQVRRATSPPEIQVTLEAPAQ
jgi:hypothetical protein